MTSRVGAVLILSILTTHLGFSQDAIDDFVQRLTFHRIALAAFHPRIEASYGEKLTLAYIAQVCARQGLASSQEDFSGIADGHSFSRSLQVTIPGRRPDTLFLALPINAAFGADPVADGAYGLALGLTVLERFAGTTPEVTLTFLFLGAEKADLPGYPMGTRKFLDGFSPAAPTAFLYIDLDDRPTSLRVETGGRGVVGPRWLVERVGAAAAASGQPARVYGERNPVFLLGRPEEDYPAEMYLKAGYAALTLRSEPAPVWAPTPPPVETDLRLLRFFDGLVRSLDAGIPESGDTHYLFVNFPFGFRLVPEGLYLAVFIAAIAGTALFAVFHPGRVRRYLTTFLRNLWNLPVFWLVCFSFLLIGTLITRIILGIRGFPELWREAPLEFLLLKLSVAAFLVAFSLHSLRRLPISRNGSFYSAAANFTFLLAILVFSAINISLSHFFLWAYLCSFVFSIVKNKAAKVLWLASAPALLVAFVADVVRLEEHLIIRSLLLSNFVGNLLIAFIFLPFFLLVMRIDLLIRHPKKGRSGFTLKLFMGVTAVSAAALIGFGLLFDPYLAKPQPLTILESRDEGTGTAELTLESPAPIGSLELRYGNATYLVRGLGRRHVIPLGNPSRLVTTRLTQNSFLSRRSVQFEANSRLPPFRLGLSFESSSDIVVYDSNLPYRLDLGQRRVDVFTGIHPPLPLTYSLVLPGDVTGTLRLVSRFSQLAEPWSIVGGNFRVTTAMVLTTTTAIEGP